MVCFRRSLAVGVFLVSALGFSQDLSVRVTYKTVAVPARMAISELGQLTHVDLRVDDRLGTQPLILRLSDVPLKDAMDRIAATLHGSWSQNKAQLTLQRTDAITAELQQAATQKKLDKVNKWLQKALKDRAQTALDVDSAVALIEQQQQQQADEMKVIADLEKAVKDKGYGPNNLPGPEDMAKFGKSFQTMQDKQKDLGHLTGDGRLYDRVLAAMDPNAFLSPYAANRIVFSTDPKPTQFKLQMSEEDFDGLVAEQNVWTEALKRAEKLRETAVSPTGSPSPDSLEQTSFAPRKPINPADARIVAVGTFSGEQMPYSFQIYIVDSKGNQLVQGNPTGGMMEYSSFEPTRSKDFSDLELPKVKLSPLAREMFAVSKAQMQNEVDGVRPASDELHRFLLDSANRDPLSLSVSETLIGIADGKSWNMVASPPDVLATYAIQGGGDGIDSAQFLETCAMTNCIIGTDDGWLTLAPSEPLKTEAERTNRPSLGQMLLGEDKVGYASIDDMAAFAAANGPLVDTSLVAFYLKLCYPAEASFQQADMSALRFYGLLSGQQRESLFQGNKVQLQLLGADQQDALIPILLASSSVEIDDSMDTEVDPATILTADQAAVKPGSDTPSVDDMAVQPLSLEVTEFLQQIPDPTVVVSLNLVEDQAVHVKATFTPSPQSARGVMGADTTDMERMEYATMFANGGESYVPPDELAVYVVRKRPNVTFSFAASPEKIINLRLKVGGKISVMSSVSEHRKDTSPFGPYAKLPEEIREKTDESIKMYQQYDQTSAASGAGSDQDDNGPPKKPEAPPGV